MTLYTLINDKADGDGCTVTTILQDDEEKVLARKTEEFTCRQAALEVVQGLRDWARARGIAIGISGL